MNFKLSLISTALLTVFQFQHLRKLNNSIKANTETLEQINVQDTGDKQNGYQTTGTIRRIKSWVPVFDTPNTVNILSTKLLEDRKSESLIDALYNVSGVSQANTLGGMFDSIQNVVLVGNRDNSIMRNGLQAGPAKNFSATTETVEVLKGRHLYFMVFKIQVVWLISLLKTTTNTSLCHWWNFRVIIVYGGTQLDFTGGLGNGFAYRFIYDKQEKDYWRNFGKVKIRLTRHHFLGKMK